MRLLMEQMSFRACRPGSHYNIGLSLANGPVLSSIFVPNLTEKLRDMAAVAEDAALHAQWLLSLLWQSLWQAPILQLSTSQSHIQASSMDAVGSAALVEGV